MAQPMDADSSADFEVEAIMDYVRDRDRDRDREPAVCTVHAFSCSRVGEIECCRV